MTLQEHIDSVLDWLDVDKVQKTMEFLDWRWAGGSAPNKAKIHKTIREMMHYAYTQEREVATGGFRVKYSKEYDIFDVEFILTCWTTNEY